MSADDRTLVESRANDGLYPGGYYYFMGLFVTDATSRSVLIMRSIAWLISVGCIVSAAAVADRRLRGAYVVAMAATSVPLGLFIMASNNPSGIAYAGVGAFWCGALVFMTAASRVRRRLASIIFIVSALAAVNSRADAGLYIAAAALAVVVYSQGWSQKSRRRALLVSGTGFLSLLGILLGQQARSAAGGLADETGRSGYATLWNNIINLPYLWTGSLGTWGLGWLDTMLPAAVWVGVTSAVAGLVFWSLGFKRSYPDIGATMIMFSTIVIVPLFVLQQSGNIVGESVQPRYLLPAIPVILATLLLSVPQSQFRALSRGQLSLLLAILTMANSIALHANLRRYITGTDVLHPILSDPDWWWAIPISPMLVWAVGSISFAAILILAFRLSDIAVQRPAEALEEP